VHLVSTFLCQTKYHKKKYKKKVDRKPERAVYEKGKPKERECEKTQKVD